MTDETTPAEPAEAAVPAFDKNGRPWTRVPLDNPIKRGDQEIRSVMVRKPLGGDLRGTELVKAYNMDVVTMSMIVPRITEPTIHRQEFMDMDGEDIAALSSEVVSFLLTKSQKAEAGLNA